MHVPATVRSLRQIALLAPVLGWLGGCASLTPSDTSSEADALPESLTVIIAELKLHMRDDTYRFERAAGPDGGDVYAVALWRLDRLAALRARPEGEWQNADYLIEFARGNALERLRRYGEAAAAYARVEASGSVLGDAAAPRRQVAERFALAAAAPAQPFSAEEEELAFIAARLEQWRGLAIEFRDVPQESLAREEAEAWEVMRVDGLTRYGQREEAIRACRALIESNRESKLFGQHLLRLGDLYADSARREQLKARTNLSPLDAAKYDALLDQAVSAYELAAEAHQPAMRREARTRIDSLQSYHEEVRAHAP
jgi:tetratricopeptide (TPR) repeat protein